jgi:hypothetical protein
VKESNSKDADDKKGGFHETSGYAAPAASGNPSGSVYYDVIPSVPGKAADPTQGGASTNSTPADPSKAEGAVPTIFWHVHPRGTKGDKGFAQQPSDTDKLGAVPGTINIVVGARNNRVYMFNDTGAVHSMSWNQFMKPNDIP